LDERRAPLMGVLGAFVFSAQMINFSIPGTGSSGHLGGGMLLAVLLGPHAAFLTIASVLMVQALFFGDGGLLALGCNILNLGLFPCFIAYPLVYRRFVGSRPTRGRIIGGSMAGAIVGLELGALGVVLETTLSGVSALPFGTFVLFMLPIHLAIGAVEGFVTAMTVMFVWRARPELFEVKTAPDAIHNGSMKTLVIGLAIVTAIIGGILSWFASSHLDGLEWSMFQTSGKEELDAPEAEAFEMAATFQEKTTLLPDYDFKRPTTDDVQQNQEGQSPVNPGTSLAGLLGSLVTLGLAGGLAFVLRPRQNRV
jgi:cobalt/nickel transport system permease protein